MRVQVAGRQVDVGEALKSRITEDLTRGVEKYFSSRPADAVVTVGREGPFFQVDCTLHLDSGMRLQAEGQAPDPHMAFQEALDRIEKRVRRYKRRLKNHHVRSNGALPAEPASAYVLSAIPTEDHFDDLDTNHSAANGDPADHASLVVAETTVEIRTMPVAMAALQLELAEAPALLFRNAAHGRLNMVFRRSDGNIGWVDPDRLASA